MRVLLLGLSPFVAAAPALAEDPAWRTSWDGALYAYAAGNTLRDDGILNPANQVARLAQRRDNIEARFNFKVENESLRFTARPIVAAQNARNGFGSQQHNEAYLSQWQARARVGEAWNVLLGREVMNWGAAQMRSPSSPFYFDNARSNPMRELSGMDMVKVAWTPNMQTGVQFAHIVGSGYAAPQDDPWRQSWLAKLDQHFSDGALGVVAVKAPDRGPFVGAHGQLAANDAVLLYGEASSSVLPYALQSPADMALPFEVVTPSPRRNTALLGVSYTRDGGDSFAAEYLHDGHGYDAAQQDAYFQRAATAPGMTLGLAPRLLGQDHLHLVWQSNLMESEGNYRLMFTRHLNDGSSELGGYAERTINTRLGAFVLASVAGGSARQEAARLLTNSIIVGAKVALP